VAGWGTVQCHTSNMGKKLKKFDREVCFLPKSEKSVFLWHTLLSKPGKGDKLNPKLQKKS
jgi:hypothetical protein